MVRILIITTLLSITSCKQETNRIPFVAANEVKFKTSDGKTFSDINAYISEKCEKAYYEGQHDALTGDIRIEKVKDSEDCWQWIKSPWDDNSQPKFHPPICKENGE